MRFSKKNQVLLFSSIAAATTALALLRDKLQTNPQQLLEKTVEGAVQKWKKTIFLTSKQVEPMRKTLTEFAVKKNEILRLKINKEGRKERLRELQLLENEEVRKFLTDSQYDKYIAIVSERVR